MDIVNTLSTIIPKMRQQMYQKGVYSLDVLYKEIESAGEKFPIKELDLFFAKFGIYLKSQEVTEILNHCRFSDTQINLIKFVYLFRTKVPEDIIKLINKVFDRLSDGQPSMDVEQLLQNLEVREHPLSLLLKEDLEKIKASVLEGFKLILGNKKLILREEFLEFNYNMFWVIPESSYDNFKLQIPLMWGIRRLK